jgi:bacteriorhodopsin
MSSANDWLALGVVGMTAGSVILALIGVTMRKEDRHHVYLAMAITLIAATAYFAMLHNLGDIVVGGVTVQLARYADWVITTPLLLISLVSVALPSGKSRAKMSLLWSLVGLDVYMILTGLFATLVDSNSRWYWYAFSCVALLGVVYMLYGTVMKESKKVAGKKISQLYMYLALYLSVLWVAYPVVWYYTGVGANKMSFAAENYAYAVLDLLAKVGFGILVLVSVSRLAASAKPKAGESSVEAASK